MSVQNPLNNYDFALEVAGVIQARIQKVTAPTIEFAVHKHGNDGNNPDAKTPGKKKVGDMTVEVVVPGDLGDPETWLLLVDAATGLREAYIQNAFLLEFGVGGVAVGRFFLGNIWLMKLETSDYDSREDNSDVLIRTMTWSVGDYVKVG